MKRVACFIDGFNLYHSIASDVKRNIVNPLNKYKWLDLYSLFNSLVFQKSEKVTDVFFFTALAKWDQDKVKRHSIYIKGLEEFRVTVVQGAFRKKDKYCKYCRKTTKTYEEKETDVNIALYLLKLAFKDKYDTAMILSGDSDLSPAIREIKAEFPNKEICTVIPPNRRADVLKSMSHRTIKLNESHLSKHQLPDPIICKNGIALQKPPQWI